MYYNTNIPFIKTNYIVIQVPKILSPSGSYTQWLTIKYNGTNVNYDRVKILAYEQFNFF